LEKNFRGTEETLTVVDNLFIYFCVKNTVYKLFKAKLFNMMANMLASFFLNFVPSLGEQLIRRVFSRYGEWRSVNLERYLFFKNVILDNKFSHMS